MTKAKRQCASKARLDDLDPYFTCPEAIASLIALEGNRLPELLWEPAAGDGAIVHPLDKAGRFVIASDIHDYGLEGCRIWDYLTAKPWPGIQGIVTNPPYRRALQFAQKALGEVPYVALLVRSNFDVEGVKRMPFRASHPPTRIWRSARRLPMMHRYGWTENRHRATRHIAGSSGSTGCRVRSRRISIGASFSMLKRSLRRRFWQDGTPVYFCDACSRRGYTAMVFSRKVRSHLPSPKREDC